MNDGSVRQKNFKHLYGDVFWYGLLAGSTITFLAIYMARLGANGFQIGLLTAGPGMVNLLASLPAGRWLESRAKQVSQLIGATFWAAVWYRISYLFLIFLPWILSKQGQVDAIIWITLLAALPATLLAIGINALLAEVIPADWRAEVVGKRNALLAVSMTISILACGLALDQVSFPLNYQIVFAIGFFGAAVSAYHLSQIQPLQPSAAGHSIGLSPPRWATIGLSLRSLKKQMIGGGAPLRSLVDFDMLRGRMGFFLLVYLLFYFFQYLPIPLFPLSYVNTLHLSDGMISLGSGLFYGAMFLTSLRLKGLAVVYGHRRMLIASAIALGGYPLIIGLAKGPFLFWVASFIGGATYGVVSASLINRLMEVVPEQKRAAGMSFHNLVLNLGILAGSLAGPLLGDMMGIQGALILSAGLRLLAGLLMIFWA